MSRRKISLVIIVAAFTFSSASVAQQCNLSRKTIVFKLTLCSKQGCDDGQENIDFVGDRAVHYADMRRSATVYRLGRTVDFCDPGSEHYLASECMVNSSPARALGTASYVGQEIRLEINQSWLAGNVVPIRAVSVIRIQMNDCSSCKAVEVSTRAYANGAWQTLSQMSGPQSQFCMIQDTPSAPRR